MTGPAVRPAIARAGIVLAVLQFAFALTWIVYAAFLPELAAQVGIASSVVPWILLADQAIFLVCDWLAGVFADRVGDAVARLGRAITAVALVSCAAFLALPLVAPAGSAPVLVALVVVWSASSSMLRAPPLALAGRHASRPQRAWLASAYSLGLAASGAVAPHLGRAMVAVDPRIPFAVTSIVVAAAVLVVTALPLGGTARTPQGGAPGSIAGLVAAVAVLAIGFQVHTSITSAAIYLRFAAPEALTDLLPVFGYGSAVAALPAAPLVRRAGGLAVMAGAAVVGAAALAACALAGSLAAVIAAQVIAGLAWGAMLSGAFAAASSLERRPGAATGLVFSVLAAATVARIALVASGAAAGGAATALLVVPPIAWAAGALIAGAAAVRRPGALPSRSA
jgi:MFS family permease